MTFLRAITVMGKLESSPAQFMNTPSYLPWHAHVTALTIAPAFRRLGLASRLTESLETAGDSGEAWFVDLYVRASNSTAINMYKKMGYSVYRKVVGYYTDGGPSRNKNGEDAYDMRKPLKRDKNKQHIRENGENVEVQPEDVW
jgi:N-terminal acetyltransferase B complex catalytic subunit